MNKELFVGITSIVKNGRQHFAEVVVQPDFEDYPGTHTPLIRIQVPVKSINISLAEQQEIEETLKKAIDWSAIDALSRKAK